MAYDLSKIMTTAWGYRRDEGKSMSEAMTQAWADAKKHSLVDRLIKIGGKEWKKAEHHRIYFGITFLQNLLDFEYEVQKGRVKNAFLKGEDMSNRKALQLYCAISSQNYYDVKKDAFRTAFKNEIMEKIS